MQRGEADATVWILFFHQDRAREVADAASAAFHLSSGRPGTTHAGKTAMQRAPEPTVSMHSRMRRLGRHSETKP
eukprot:1285355-Pyramimonas_sp.AAC.1